MTAFLPLLATEYGFLFWGWAAAIGICIIMYMVFAKETSLNSALGDTLFRSTGIALLVSAALAFSVWYFLVPKLPQSATIPGVPRKDVMIGACAVIGLLLFILWRMRIVRGRRKRKRKVRPGI